MPDLITLTSGRAIERYLVQSREQWLEWRGRDITASAAGALLGGHPYISLYALWALKSGKLQEEQLETAPMRRGRLLEPVAIQLLEEERPDWKIERAQRYYRDPAKRIGATPDALAQTPEGLAVVQVKSVEPGVFGRQWRGEEGVEPPLWIALQAMVESELTGADLAYVAALTVSFGVELHVVEVDLSHRAAILARLEEAVAQFWESVKLGHAPDPDYGRDLDLIETLYKPTGQTISLEGDNEVLPLIEERTLLGRGITDAQKRLSVIKGSIMSKLGTASAGILPDGRLLKSKLITRKAYTVKASSYYTFPVSKEGAEDE